MQENIMPYGRISQEFSKKGRRKIVRIRFPKIHVLGNTATTKAL